MSIELAKTQCTCYEFECFEDNYSLTISAQGCRINTRKFNTRGTEERRESFTSRSAELKINKPEGRNRGLTAMVIERRLSGVQFGLLACSVSVIL